MPAVRPVAAIVALLLASTPAYAQVQASPTPAAGGLRFARIFTDHAVVQRGRPIAVWGYAKPRATVRVTLGDAVASVRADARGTWRAALPARAAGGPYALTATAGAEQARLADVMVGDVYLCSGQSNMEFPARLSTGAWSGLGAPADPGLRFVTITKASEPAPLDDLRDPVAWKTAAPDTVGDASAVCYYMARSLRKTLKVPIGFVAADWGGTTIEGWISAAALRTLPAYAPGIAQVARLASDPAGAKADDARRQEAWWDAHLAGSASQRAWIAPGFDDATWPSFSPAGSWKEAGIPALAAFDGVMWLRQRITLTATQAAAANSLQLGTIDTFDTCWVNGQRVGSGTANWATRDYPLPAGTLHAGDNEIVLRVLGGGGLTGDPQARGIKTGDGTLVPLDRAWRYQLGARATGLSVAPAPWDVPNSLTTLYNGMIAPIAGYGYTLAAWYQGESNTAAARDYATLLPMMMADWRRATGQPTLPFLIVQLAAYGPPRSEPGESDWATLRDIQAKVARADPHAALAAALDVGDRFDIHPSQKSVVGERLARAARARAYGEPIAAGGPEALTVTRGTNRLAIRFRDTGAGLRTYGADVAIGFEACDAARCRYVPGKAAGDIVTLAVADAAAVTRVRYAWADAPPVNLYNSDDLPAVPFELPVGAP